MREMKNRMDIQEQRTHTLINFFASALKNPSILHRLYSTVNSGGPQRIQAAHQGGGGGSGSSGRAVGLGGSGSASGLHAGGGRALGLV